MRLLALLLALPLAAHQPFRQELWSSIETIYGRTLEHPFLLGLSDGTLPPARFQFYLEQDTLYLGAFAQALEKLARKAPDAASAAILKRHATEAIAAEKSLHRSILDSYGGTWGPRKMAPNNYAYTQHFLRAVEQEPFAEGLAALLPCYWIYLEVGRVLVKRGSKDPNYQKWITNYASDDYAKSVNEVLAMMDKQGRTLPAARRKRCFDLFTLSARYEYLFWDMAWTEQRWLP